MYEPNHVRSQTIIKGFRLYPEDRWGPLKAFNSIFALV